VGGKEPHKGAPGGGPTRNACKVQRGGNHDPKESKRNTCGIYFCGDNRTGKAMPGASMKDCLSGYNA